MRSKNTVSVRILGEAVLQVGEHEIRPGAPQLFATLLILALERGKAVPRAVLAEMLFPDASHTSATHRLRQLLYRIRGYGAPLCCSTDLISLPTELVEVDAHLELSMSYREHLRYARDSIVILPSYQPPTQPISRWVESRRDTLQTALISRLAAHLDYARRSAEWNAVDLLARRVLELDPLHETATLCLAEALARTGSKQKAVALLQQYEADAGGSTGVLALPSRLLKRRLSAADSPRSDALGDIAFVGRSAEMKELSELWINASRGRCTAVRIVGEKGIGKSRLASEFVALTIADDSGTVISCRRSPSDQLRPYAMLADVSRQLLALPGAAGCEPGNLPVITQLASAQAELNAEPPNGDACPPPSAVRRATLDLLDAISAEKPLLFLIEDGKYLDDGSRAFLDELPSLNPRLPVMAVIVGDERSTVAPGHTLLRLSPLEGEELQRLAVAMNDRLTEELTPELLGWCEHISGGNPGYLELLAIQTAGSRSTRTIPHDLIALLDERLSSLEPCAQHCLVALAILGDSSPATAVEAITGLGAYAVLASLEQLERACLIAASPEGLRCRSDLIRERALRASTQSAKTLLHARAARHLDAQHSLASVSPATASRIAMHWQAAGEVQFARKWQRACWRHTVSIGQPMAAAEAIRSELPRTSSVEDRALLLDELSHALDAAGEHAERVDALRERIGLSGLCGDSAHTRRALECDLAEASLSNHDPEPLHAPQLQRLLRSGKLDARRTLRACRALMIIAHNMLDIELAREVFATTSQLMAPDSVCAQRQAQVHLIYHTIFGDPDQALALADYLRSQALGAPLSEFGARSLMNITLSRWVVDPAPLSLSDLYQSFQQLRAAGMNSYALHCSSRIAFLLHEDCQWEEAIHWSQIARDLNDSLNHDRRPMDFMALQMNIALHLGNVEAARGWLDLMPRASPRLATGLNESALQLYGLKFKLLGERQPATEADLSLLLSWHERARTFGRHDEHVAVLSLALASVGRSEEALKRILEYLAKHRRERRRLSPLHAEFIRSATGLSVQSHALLASEE